MIIKVPRDSIKVFKAHKYFGQRGRIENQHTKPVPIYSSVIKFLQKKSQKLSEFTTASKIKCLE